MKNLNIDDFSDPQELLDAGFGHYDAYRTENLQNLAAVKQIQAKQLNREYARLRQKYGENHPLTLQTQAKIGLNAFQYSEIKKEADRAETPEPSVSEEKWIIYGYVRAADGSAAPNVLVFLLDEKRQKIDAVEPVKTNENGYFVFEIEKIKSLPAAVYVGVSPHESSQTPLKPQAGKSEYAEIVLSGNEPSFVAPTQVNRSPSKDWTVAGKILGAGGEGRSGLTVKVYDKDVFDDDFLSETTTDDEGFYSVTFPKEKFRDLTEEYPEVYLVVENASGERVYNGRSRTNYGAGYIELLDVQLKDA